MAGYLRRGGTRVHWLGALFSVIGAMGLVSVGVQAGEAGVVPTQVGFDTVEAGVYFDQVGLDIVGAEPVVSADVDRIAVQPTSLSAEVFDWDGAGWSLVGAAIDGGYPKAMSGDGQRLAVGIAREDAGWVRVFDWDGAAWTQLGADIDGDAAGDRFGWSVAMSADGNRVAIGAAGGPSGAGYVRVLEWDGVAWSLMGADIEGEAAWEDFGWSVAMSVAGDRVAISERPHFTGEPFDRSVSGSVRVFDWDGAGWSQVGGDIAAVGDDVALSSSGDRLAAGMRGDWDMGPSGRVWVLDLVGGSWVMVDYSQGRPAQSVALSADGRRLAYSGNKLNGPIDVSPGLTVVRDERSTGWVDVGSIGGEFFSSSDDWVGLSADGDRVAIGGSGYVRVFEISATPHPPLASPMALAPARLLDSRVGAKTVDGVSDGIGRRSAGSVTEVSVAGRGGVPVDALAVMLDVVAVRPDAGGYLTVFPCGTPVPLASNLNYAPGQVIANAVFSGIGADGTVCVYTSATTELVVDVTGYTPPVRSGLRSMYPDRLMDTREGQVVTGYETWVEVDRLAAGSVTELLVTGWPNRVPYETSAVMLDVVAVRPDAVGFLTVYPCGTPRPLASSLNYAAGQTIAKLVFARLGDSGRVCLYTSATTDIIADITGYTPTESGLSSLVPARLLDSRAGAETVDGVSAEIGRRSPGSVTEVSVTGRGQVPLDASAVILDVVAVRPDAGGYLTVYPCGTPRPLASNLNYATGQTIANAVLTGVGANGTVCIYTYASTDLVVDVSGHT